MSQGLHYMESKKHLLTYPYPNQRKGSRNIH